jgi:hypothetical protein
MTEHDMVRSFLRRISRGAPCCAWTILVSLVGSVGFVGGSASAAVTHEFLPVPSAKISEGVPAGSGAKLTGPLGSVNSLTTESGHLLVGERLNNGESRVDSFGANSGEFLLPQLNEEGGISELSLGVAVGHVAGEEQVEQVYVGVGPGDKEAVAVFGSSGKLQDVWSGANTPGGPFTLIKGVAVDSSTRFETKGDVYVATEGPAVVDVFTPQAGGAEPAKVVAQIRGTCAAPGTCLGSEIPFVGPHGVAVSGFNGDVLVNDGEKVVDIFEPTVLGQYAFVKQLTDTPNGASGRISAVAVDATNGDIYIVDMGANSTGPDVVDEFDATGDYIGRLTGTSGPSGEVLPFHSVESIAVDPLSDRLFVGDYDSAGKGGAIDVFGGDLIIPDVLSEEASNVVPLSATLNGKVNPLRQGEASCRFLWGITAQFGHEAACEPEKVAEGSSPASVSARLNGVLLPDTTYFYRLQASNKNGTNAGESFQDQQFTTPGPGLHGQSVSSVSDTSATLNATIAPHGSPTSFRFEYGTTSEYGLETPVAPGAPLGAGGDDVEVSRRLQDLAPTTTYHYRVVVVSYVNGKTEEFAGPDQLFMTQGVGSALALPDGRQWELVSPVDKRGSGLQPIGSEGVVQASVTGGVFTYLGTTPTEAGVRGFSSRSPEQILSTRRANGWASEDLSLPHASAVGASVGGGYEYRFFASDLAAGLVEGFGEFTSLTPDVSPPDSERTPYVRHDSTCAVETASCYEPLVTSASGYADVPEGAKFGGNYPEKPTGDVRFEGGSPDLAHVVLESNVPLTLVQTGKDKELYEWSAGEPASGRLQLISALPNSGLPSSGGSALGFQDSVMRNAVSVDGSRVVWSEVSGERRHLYLRDTKKGETVLLDGVQSRAFGSGAVNPLFTFASSDGSRMFFTDTQRLTEGPAKGTGDRDLYECEIVEVVGELQCKLSDLTPTPSGEDARVQGNVLGASEDGSWVYFAAGGVLAQGAVPGTCEERVSAATCNIYVWHDGVIRTVAVVSGLDSPNWDMDLSHLTARVSPDGRRLAFMSQLELTGYDNRDAVSGVPDEEVYLYEAEGESGTGKLVCASCDPTGARPVGVEYDKLSLVAGDRVWQPNQWLAANIPGWTAYALGRALYQSRYLSNEGRLFFNSSDALAPQDINGNEDVYEYEPSGVGDCSVSSLTFSSGSSGCVGLISSGTAIGESSFLDAGGMGVGGEEGEDVFFLSGEKLVSQDVDTAFDVYDAHVCSSLSLCVSSPVAPPQCVTADACRVSPTPQPSSFGPPASATFTGAGNVSAFQPVVKLKSKSKPLTSAQKLARALNACKREKGKGKRIVCERRARKRYRVKRAGKATTGKGKG